LKTAFEAELDPAATQPLAPLRHQVQEGPVTSIFLREGGMAVQLLLSSGLQPRLLFAFVAGNSAAGLWFKPVARPLQWRLVSPPRRIESLDARGRKLEGVELELAVEALDGDLHLRQALLGSARVLRNYQTDGSLPRLGLCQPQSQAPKQLSWARDRLDGAAGYALSMEVLEGELALGAGAEMSCRVAASGQPLRLRLRALSGEPPLRPLSAQDLLNERAADLPDARRSLEFLAYRDKLLAGSWRFHTYFGRDSLLSLRLLLPVLRPAAIEAVLASVLDRLNAQGEVAHEEEVGEFPVLQRRLAGNSPEGDPEIAAPIYDYKMVDDDFLLLPVAIGYLLETAAGRARAAEFLAKPAGDGQSHGGKLLSNLACVLRKAAPFAQRPEFTQLIRLKPTETVGNWRDSSEGLGGGVYPFDVNVVLVPAALAAAEALLASGLLTRFVEAAGQAQVEALELARLPMMRRVWEQEVEALFLLPLSAAQASAAIAVYAREQQLPAQAALAAVPPQGLLFSALALDEAGRPLPIMHSDFGFALLFGQPSEAALARELQALLRPFPAGLLTDVGMVVANAVFAEAALRPLFDNDRYHGAVIWSWQQAMWAAGLARQLQRQDLSPACRQGLLQAQTQLWAVIQASAEQANSELWSWAHADGRFRFSPYGPKSKTMDESNAAQLWSTVYLAVQPPSSALSSLSSGPR